MKYYLMDKNTEIVLIEYDTNLNVISKIYKKINFEYAPLNLYANQNRKDFNLEKEMNRWFKGRGIPSWRKDLERLLKNLNVKFSDELLDKAYGLSLSDQYWINPAENKLKWKDINFFTNDFEYKAFLDASILNKSSRNISLMTPNNTTDGMIQKAWIIENRKRKLIKGTFYNANQEPLNEKLTSIICRYLGFDYCNYEIEVLENKLVSKCEDFVNENTEYITAYDILQTKKKSNNISTYEHYIKILEENGIENARINIENMLLIDFLVMNIDRHLGNFGVIRNVETLKWEKLAPIFDTGEALNCDKEISFMNFKDGNGRFFGNDKKPFKDYLKYIKNIERFNISCKKKVIEQWSKMLKDYQIYTGMQDERIKKLVEGLEYRFNLLGKYIEKNK